MGTHPIFESDFDCLTDMNRISSFGTLSRNLAQCSRYKSSASYKSKIAKKTTGSSQLNKLGLDDPKSLKASKFSSGVLDSQHEKMKNKSIEMKAKWDAMTDEEKEAILENQREQARLAEEEYLKKEQSRQELYAKFVLDPQKAKDRSGQATKVFAVLFIWYIGEELDIWKDLGIYSAIINGYRSL